MKLTDVMASLERMGTEQNRKVYPRHGIASPMFGVSYADQRALAKRIGVRHDLALALWKSGNHDARLLATMIADPSMLTATVLGNWMRDLDNYVLANGVTEMIGRGSYSADQALAWAHHGDEWISTIGWSLVALLASKNASIEDDWFLSLADEIERGIHERPNRTRYAMLSSLIAIGLRNPDLRERACEVATAIGDVHVDHGETGCRTPDVIPYIDRAVAAGHADRLPPAPRRAAPPGQSPAASSQRTARTRLKPPAPIIETTVSTPARASDRKNQDRKKSKPAATSRPKSAKRTQTRDKRH